MATTKKTTASATKKAAPKKTASTAKKTTAKKTTSTTSKATSMLSSLAKSDAAKGIAASLLGKATSASSGSSIKDTLTNAALQSVVSQFTAKVTGGKEAASSLDVASIVTKLATQFSGSKPNLTGVANIVAQVFNAGYKQGKAE